MKKQIKTLIKNYRLIIFLLVILFFFVLLSFEFLLGSYAIGIRTLKIPIYPIPNFADLKILLCGIESMNKGIDPYGIVECWDQQSFNYPKTWKIFTIFPFLTSKNHITIGILIFFIFYIITLLFIEKLNFRLFVYYLIVLFSPSILLGLDRANSDLIIFIFLTIGLVFTSNKYLFHGLILFCSILKLYPIGAISFILNERKNNSVIILMISITAFAFYLYFFRENLEMVSMRTPRPYTYYSFGLQVLPENLIQNFKLNRSQTFLFYYIILAIITLVYWKKNKRKYFLNPNLKKDKFTNGYLVGSGIFIVSCIIGYNYEYRLIFLILTIPKLIQWSRTNKYYVHFLVINLLVFWQSGINQLILHFFSSEIYLLLSQLLIIYLFIFHLVINFKMLFDFMNFIFVNKFKIVPNKVYKKFGINKFV